MFLVEIGDRMDSDIARLIAEFATHQNYFEQLATEIVESIQTEFARDEIAVHSLSVRVKSAESIAEKATRKRILSLSDITDLIGVRILTYYAEDIPIVVQTLGRIFVQAAEFTETWIGPGHATYPTHLNILLSDSPRYTAEIQLRSITYHAFSEIMHQFSYKSADMEVPAGLRPFSIHLEALRDLTERTVSDYRAAIVATNLRLRSLLGISEGRAETLERSTSPLPNPDTAKSIARKLLSDFRSLLAEESREELLQRFLSDHPEFLYPDYLQSIRKFPLGEVFVTDFVLRVQGHLGAEYVFVEIEKPGKPLFVRAGQFSAEFTQAKDQLLNWEHWILRNHAYIRERLPDLGHPQFHLVMGRDKEMSETNRAKLQTEFAGSVRRFSTYDDLARRFEILINRWT
jgi:ppGpp synthetase/RelA/SpoT-type nucleotidyltranferase